MFSLLETVVKTSDFKTSSSVKTHILKILSKFGVNQSIRIWDISIILIP